VIHQALKESWVSYGNHVVIVMIPSMVMSVKATALSTTASFAAAARLLPI